MNNCETVKEVQIPGCYSGVLKVNVGLEPGRVIAWSIAQEGNVHYISGSAAVDASGNLLLEVPEDFSYIDYFNTYKLSLWENLNGWGEPTGESINIKGYDCYRLMPFKNANEVIDVVI
jgi:hypothetical protein